MSVRANATAVGAFVLGAIAIMAGIVIVFGSGMLFRDASRYVIFFTDSLEGLSVGAPVKYRGVQVGSVTDIRAVFQPDRAAVDIPVVIELDRRSVVESDDGEAIMAPLIQQGLRARLDLVSIITGQLYVQLNIFPGAPVRDFPNDTGYPQIPSIPSLQSGPAGHSQRLHRQAAPVLARRRAGPGAAQLPDRRWRCR